MKNGVVLGTSRTISLASTFKFRVWNKCLFDSHVTLCSTKMYVCLALAGLGKGCFDDMLRPAGPPDGLHFGVAMK